MFNVLVDNMMSYCGRTGECFDHNFTPGQAALMRKTISTGNFISRLRPEALIADVHSLQNQPDPVVFDTDVRILTGGHWRVINSDVEVSPGHAVIVESGGSLFTSGSHFTVGPTDCDNSPFWKGIVLENTEAGGNSSRAILNATTIELAEKGIAYGRNEVSLANLGQLAMEGGQFINNKVAIDFANGQFETAPSNQQGRTIINDVDFVIDGNFPDDGSNDVVGAAIKLAYARPMRLRNCTFELPSLPGTDDDNGSVQAINALATFIDIGTQCYQEQTGCDPSVNIASTFTNYPVGVSLELCGNSRIATSLFDDCRVGVMADLSPDLSIVGNTFYPRDLEVGLAPIVLNESSGYMIDQNKFEIIGAQFRTSAIRIQDCGESLAFVMNNDFKFFWQSVVYFQGQNGSSTEDFIGSKVECNTFESFSIFSTNFPFGPYEVHVDEGATIANFQGSSVDPAGNTFSDFDHAGSDLLNGVPGQLNNDFVYYYSSLSSFPDNNPINALGVNTIAVNDAPLCPVEMIGGFYSEGGENNVSAENTGIQADESIRDDEGDPLVADELDRKLYERKENYYFLLKDWIRVIESDTTANKYVDLAILESYRLSTDVVREAVLKLRFNDFEGGMNDLSQKMNSVTNSEIQSSIQHGSRYLYTATEQQKLRGEAENGEVYSRRFLELFFNEYGKTSVAKAGSLPTAKFEGVDIDESKSKFDNISVYPNPIVGDYIVIEGLNNPSIVKLYDVSGRLLTTKIVSVEIVELSVRGLEKGVFIVTTSDENGNVSYHKIIKQ